MPGFEAEFNVQRPEIAATFDLEVPSLDVEFETQSPEIEAIFEINPITGDKNFVYEQATPSDVWRVLHNLNKRPSITVVDSAENVVVGAYEYLDNNRVILKFNSAFIGKAYFN